MKRLFVILLILSFTDCHHSELGPINCGVSKPLTDLPWLVSITKNSIPDLSITQATYQRETVYVVGSCGRCFAGPNVAIYRCDGTTICSGLLLYGNSSPACKFILDSLTDRQVLLTRN